MMDTATMDKRETDERKRARLVLEIVLAVIALSIFGYLLYKHTPKVLKLLEDGNISGIESYIKGEGSKGMFVLILLQIIETVAIVLPAMPVYICAGAVYGKIQGILMCYITNFVMNVLIFLVARTMKVSMAEFAKFQKNPKLDEWIKEAKHMDRVVLLMCMLPVIPNGMIPYISAQTNVSLKDFAKAMSIGCLPGVVFFVCCGDFLLSEHFHITLPIVIIAAVVITVMMIFRKRIAAWLEPRIRKFLL